MSPDLPKSTPDTKHLDPGISQEIITSTREALSFTGLRYLSNALWIGGTALGVYAERKTGVSPWLICPTIAGGVTGIEYAGSSRAVRLFTEGSPQENSQDNIPQNHERASRKITKELGGLAYTVWAGAMSAVKVNNVLGLESSRKRRLAQSASYGLAVSLWASNLPGFKQAQDGVIKAGEFGINNPIEAAGIGASGSLAIYGVLRAAQYVKNRSSRPQNK